MKIYSLLDNKKKPVAKKTVAKKACKKVASSISNGKFGTKKSIYKSKRKNPPTPGPDTGFCYK